MAPSTWWQRKTADTTLVATSTETTAHSVSSKKKGDGTKTHPKLPPLVIKQPTKAGGGSGVPVPFRKHTLSPDEGPTTNAEGLPKRPNLVPEAPRQFAERAKVGGLGGAHPPRLELLDDKVEPMPAGVGNVPPNSTRKLRQSETLVHRDFENGNLSLDNNISHSSVTGSKDEDSEPVEDKEYDDMVAFMQTARSSQWMAVERPSWLKGATEDAAEAGVPHLNGPDNMPLSIPSSCRKSLFPAQTSTHVCSERPTGKHVRFKDQQDSEISGEPILISVAFSINLPQIPFQDSQTPFLMAHFERHSEGQQMALIHSECCQVVATGLEGTTSKGQQAILSYPSQYPQAVSLTSQAPLPRVDEQQLHVLSVDK
ncbi:hypothetical protein H4582DRAFT_2086258 [Lactarius indigo]|nr:hypothetical protein H4582DRAFT_2086258 [Lactarius indigo]